MTAQPRHAHLYILCTVIYTGMHKQDKQAHCMHPSTCKHKGGMWLPPVGDSAKTHPVTLPFASVMLQQTHLSSLLLADALFHPSVTQRPGCLLSPLLQRLSHSPLVVKSSNEFHAIPQKEQVYVEIDKVLNQNKRGLLENFKCPWKGSENNAVGGTKVCRSTSGTALIHEGGLSLLVILVVSLFLKHKQ